MTRDASTQTRTILVHLNVDVPEGDNRAPEEIVAALCGAISVGSDDDSIRELGIAVALYEEI